MTRFERRLAVDTAVLGTLLTLLVIVIDWAGGLQSAENYLSDHRARYCQHFAPPPTDKIVHLDIDDTSLDAIGRWPWPRSKLASIIDELNVAGAKTIAMDIIFPDPQQPTAVRQNDGTLKWIDEDAVFAAAVARKHNVLIPINVESLGKPVDTDQLRADVITELMLDPEADDAAIVNRVKRRGQTGNDVDKRVEKIFSGCLREALFRRLISEMDSDRPCDVGALEKRLLPHDSASGIRTSAIQMLEVTLPKVEAYRELRRVTRQVPANFADLLGATSAEAPIPVLAKATEYTGFVDFLRFNDGVVRAVPLWTVARDRLVPHISLAFACATLGVDIHDIKLEPDRVTLPLPDGRKIVIPVHRVRSENVGDADMFMEIPFFGKSDEWLTMYDWPKHEVIRQHLPVAKVWDVCQIAPAIEENDLKAFKAVETVLVRNSQDDVKAFRKDHPAFDDAAGWNKQMADLIDGLAPGTLEGFADYLKPGSTADWGKLDSDNERDFVRALVQLKLAQKINDDLLQQRDALRADLRQRLSGKSILIGFAAVATLDRWATRIHSDCPGVAINGAVFNAIMTNWLVTERGKGVAALLTFAIGLLTTIAAARLTPWKALVAAGLVAATYLIVNGEVAYDWSHVEIGMAGPIVASALIWSGCTLFKFIRESVEKARITARFRSYVDPKLVNFVLEHPERAGFDGENRELTVVFTDLQGFTTLSEKLKEETVHLLNQYLGIMQPIIDRHHGLVNKFLGDGIMFFFGAPDPVPGGEHAHARAAVDCVVDMQAGMIGLNEDLARRGLPTLRMRVGVSSGDMIVGDAGSRQRSDYTVLGDRVNFASRLEGANKATGTLILLSERTVELLDGAYLVRPIGRLQVVGKKEPVMTFEPIARAADATDAQRKLVELTGEVVDCFVAADFAACTAAADRLVAEFGQSKLASLYHHLCAEYTLAIPADFAGQIKLESK